MSSRFRNIGSAMTFGAIETAKAKEARVGYLERYERHEERHEPYSEFVTWLPRAWRSSGGRFDGPAEPSSNSGLSQWTTRATSSPAGSRWKHPPAPAAPVRGSRLFRGARALAAGIGAPAAAWAWRRHPSP